MPPRSPIPPRFVPLHRERATPRFAGGASTIRRTLGLCVALLLALGPVAMADESSVDELRLDAGDRGQRVWAPSAPTDDIVGSLTVFTDRAVFDAAFPGAVLEDFEAGAVASGATAACAAPLDAGGDGTCFGPGDLVDGFVVQDLPGPDAVDGLLLIGDGTFANPTKSLAVNTLADSLEIAFPEPVEAVGFEAINLPGPADSLSVDVFGPNDLLLGSVSTASSAAGVFWGVSSPTPIARLVLTSTINEAEAVDDLAFAVAPFLVLEAVAVIDTCGPAPAGDNGTIEPGEEIELTVSLRASAGAFTGIVGSLSSAQAGVTVLSTTSPWPDLAVGAVGTNQAPLRFAVVDDGLCQRDVALSLEVASDQGSFTIPITLGIGAEQAPQVPVPIPDGTGSSATSELVIATATTIADLAVEVAIEHTWVGDLTVSLTSPASTTVVLLDRPGNPGSPEGCNNNDVRVTFSDAAATDPETFCSPASSDPWITGDVLPAQPLAAFDGETTDGTWTLTVTDSLSGDVGTLVDWRLLNTDPIGAECVACGSQSDLQILKDCTDGFDPVCVLEVTNLGPSAAVDVEVIDTLPPPLLWVADDCGAGPPVADVLTWTIGALDIGTTVFCTVQLTSPPDVAGTVLNVATVSTSIPDPQPENDTAEEPIILGTVLDVPVLDTHSLLLLGVVLALSALTLLRRRRAMARSTATSTSRRDPR
ncbi:MAG: proprotein convertase P-domain-containing protein [Acidobacteriota bacterium]